MIHNQNQIRLDLSSKKNEANEVAIFLVKSLKLTFEKYFSDCETDKKNISLDYIFNSTDVKKVWKKERLFKLDLLDDSLNFYKDLIRYFLKSLIYMDDINMSSMFEIPRIKEKIKSKFTIYYLSILLDLLLKILNDNKDAYNDNIIKFDIAQICELFRDKNLRIISSHSFFYCCVKELCKKYKIEIPMKNDFRINNFKIYSDKAKEILGKEKNNLVTYIKGNLSQACDILVEKRQKIYYDLNPDTEKLKDFDNKIEEITDLINNINNIEDIIENKNKKKIIKYLKEYAEYDAEKNCFKIEPKKTKYINS